MLFENQEKAGERNKIKEPVLKIWPASEAESVTYNGFGSERYIRYRPNGALKGQNGTYVICSNAAGRKLILSAYGRLRSATSKNCSH